MTIKAIFFDLDGTLLDSAPDFYATVDQICDEYQVPKVPHAKVRATVSDGARALTKLAFGEHLDEPSFHQRHQRLLDIYAQNMGKYCQWFTGVDALLAKIHQQRLFWGIITNKPARFTDPILARLPLPTPPNLVICPDHVRQAKPSPEALQLACKKVGCTPEQAIYIGDHPRDIICGQRAGSPTIAVSFGYLKNTDDAHQWRADKIAHQVQDIWPAIQSLMQTP